MKDHVDVAVEIARSDEGIHATIRRLNELRRCWKFRIRSCPLEADAHW